MSQSGKPSRTKLDCPSCKRVVPCKAVTKSRKGQHGRVAWPDAKDIIWYRRKRKCSHCGHEFVTAEMEAKFLDELRALRRETSQAAARHQEALDRQRAEAEALRSQLAVLKQSWHEALRAVNSMSRVFYPGKPRATPAKRV